jgi:hypothetical protein
MRNLFVALSSLAGLAVISPAFAASDRVSRLDKVPKLNVAESCREAQAIAGEDKNLTYKGCMQDETEARQQLAKKWSSFKLEDRRNCVEGGAAPLPSYVEILTCLEMYDQASTLYRPTDQYTPNQAESVLPATQLPSATGSSSPTE